MPVFRIYKTSSFEKRCNIYCHLMAREYCSLSNHRRIHHILGTLITQGNYSFKKEWCRSSKKHIACDGRFAFFDNYQNCIDCNSHFKEPRLKFTVQQKKPGKIEDAIVMEGCPETVSLNHHGYRSSLFALVTGNILRRVDMETGQVLEEVSLGRPAVKFKKIQWNVAEESFTIYSTLIQKDPIQNLRQVQEESLDQEVLQLIVMTCMPLRLTGKLSITRQIFGRDVVEAAVFLDILMVMFSSNYIRLYSLERILETGRTHSLQLYERLPDGSLYGKFPSHLSHNIILKETPPCLFEVRCRNRDMMLTMPPCHYIIWPLGNSNGYCCFSFNTQKMVEGGLLDAEECELEERVSLHADDSGRIVHMKNSQLRVLKLQPSDSTGDHMLVEDFVISFDQVVESSVLRVSQSGRVIKPRVIENCAKLADRVILSMVYCEDQDMMVVMSTRDHDGSGDFHNCIIVGFYDNWTGQLLRQFALQESATETLERSILISLDTITHVYKTSHGRFECHVYKLHALPDLQDEWQGGLSQVRGSKEEKIPLRNRRRLR